MRSVLPVPGGAWRTTGAPAARALATCGRTGLTGHLRQDWPDWQVGQGHRAAVAAYLRRMEMISTGSTGTSRIPFFTPVLTPEMASTTSMPEVTWPKTA